MRLELVLEKLTTLECSGDGLTWCKGHALLSSHLSQAHCVHSSFRFLHVPLSSHSGGFLLRGQCLCRNSPAPALNIGSLLWVPEALCVLPLQHFICCYNGLSPQVHGTNLTYVFLSANNSAWHLRALWRRTLLSEHCSPSFHPSTPPLANSSFRSQDKDPSSDRASLITKLN